MTAKRTRVPRVVDWDRSRYSIVPPRAALDPALTVIHTKLLIYLGSVNSDDGWCEMSQSVFAKALNYNVGSVTRAVAELVKWQYLEKRGQRETKSVNCHYRVKTEKPKPVKDGETEEISTSDVACEGADPDATSNVAGETCLTQDVRPVSPHKQTLEDLRSSDPSPKSPDGGLQDDLGIEDEISEDEPKSSPSKLLQLLRDDRRYHNVVEYLLAPILTQRRFSAKDPLQELLLIRSAARDMPKPALEKAVAIVLAGPKTVKVDRIRDALKAAKLVAKADAADAVPTDPDTERVRSALRKRLGEDVYRSWFSGMTVRNDGGRMLLVAPTRMHASWIISNYTLHVEAVAGASARVVHAGEVRP